MAKTQRSYGFDPDDLAWLESEAKRRDVTVSWLVRRIVRDARLAQADDERQSNGQAA